MIRTTQFLVLAGVCLLFVGCGDSVNDSVPASTETATSTAVKMPPPPGNTAPGVPKK